MHTEIDLSHASVSELMQELAARFAQTNGIEFVDANTLRFVRDCIECELASHTL